MPLLALIPLGLTVYLGQFSRLMSDDYCIVAVGRDLGAWGSMAHWFNHWSSSYSLFFLQGLLAPMDTLVPAIAPTLIIALWFPGVYFLSRQLFAPFKDRVNHWRSTVTVSALAITAAIHALFTLQSIYWAGASIASLIPLAAFIMGIVFAIRLATQRVSKSSMLKGLIAVAGICFFTAGMEEMFLVFQTVLLAQCLFLAVIFYFKFSHRRLLIIVGAALFATLVSLAIQLASGGVAIRAAYIIEEYGEPNRSLSHLASETVSRTFHFVSAPNVFQGILLLLFLGILLNLMGQLPLQSKRPPIRIRVAPRMLVFGLVIQVAFAPLLWLHVSDNREILGLFSVRFATLIVLNLALIVLFVVALRFCRRINMALSGGDVGLLLIWLSLAFGIVIAFLMIVIRTEIFNEKARLYLSATAALFLILIVHQLLSASPSSMTLRYGWLAFLLFGSGIVCALALVFVALYGRGFATARILTPVAFLLVMPGLIWGLYLGHIIRCSVTDAIESKRWLRILRVACLSVILIIGGHIVGANAALISDFQQYAREWDERHQSIIKQRDEGQLRIEVLPLTFNLSAFMHVSTLDESPSDECAQMYYGVESIKVIKS